MTKWRTAFRHQGYHSNSLSSHIWDLKRRNVNFELKWRIVAKSKPYSPSSKVCELCTSEINYIMFKRNMATLNSRSEFFGFCLHKGKYLLRNQWKITIINNTINYLSLFIVTIYWNILTFISKFNPTCHATIWFLYRSKTMHISYFC